MQIKPGLRQAAISMMVFTGMLVTIISFDARVRERVGDVMAGGDGVTSLGDRLADLAEAVMTAARYQSIENGPLLIFTVVGAVLFLFMFRT